MYKFTIDPEEHILRILDIKQAEVSLETKHVLHLAGCTWSDQHLQEDIYSIEKCVEGIEQFGQAGGETEKVKAELAALQELLNTHNCSYIRLIEYGD